MVEDTKKQGIEATEKAGADDQKKIDEALKAYKIDEKYVLGKSVDPAGVVTIVTKGGAKSPVFARLRNHAVVRNPNHRRQP